MKNRAWIALSVSVSMVAASNATVIGFGELGGSNATLPSSLGSTAYVDGSGYVVSNGITPNIAVEWDAVWQVHTSTWFDGIESQTIGGGDWDNEGGIARVAQLDTGFQSITFSADAGYALVLESFDFGYTSETPGITEWDLTLTNSSGTEVWSQSLVMDNSSPATSIYVVNPNFTGDPGETYTLNFNRTSETVDTNGRHAIDNLSFFQTPEGGVIEVENGTTIIGFGELGGNNSTVPASLGSNAFTDGNGYTVTNGGTFKISLEWDSNWDIHTSTWFDGIENQTVGGGNWDSEGDARVAQLDSGSHSITFSAQEGYALILESFDFGQTAETTGITYWDLALTNSSGTTVWSQTLMLDNASPATSIYTVAPNFTGEGGESYTLTFDRTSETYGSDGRHALDNLTFSQIDFSAADAVTDLVITGPILEGTAMELSWSCEKGKPYGVETRSSLISGVWETFETGLTSAGTTIAVTNTIGAGQTFYRVISE